MDVPVLSVLTASGGPGELRRTYEALAAQTDRRWQWCLVPEPGAADPTAGLPLDPRVLVTESVTGGPGHRLAAAFEAATGGHVMTVAGGDLLAGDTVETVALLFTADGWGYGDEEQRFPSGRTPDVWEKPEHSPERLRSQPYPGRSAILPRPLLAGMGGIRAQAASAAWHDAVLRVSEQTLPPLHVAVPLAIRTDPRLTCRFVDGDPADFARAVGDHCARTGVGVDDITPVVVQGRPVGFRLHRTPRHRPSVSIVVPTRGGTTIVRGRPRRHVVELARSLWVEGRYPDLELVVVYDADTPPDVLDDLRSAVGADLVLVPYEGWFHFSRKCNIGALAARGEYLCFLNDDIQVDDPGWLGEMVTHLDDPGVGAVGARLLFADGSLQHIGHQYSGGVAGHPLFGWRSSTLALGAAAQVAGERAGVTAACMLVRSVDFAHVGGFSEVFPVNYNDVDLCLKLRMTGFRIVYTPHAELIHFESQSRVARIRPSEEALLTQRWSRQMLHDPYIRQSRPVSVRSKFRPAEARDTGPADAPDPGDRPDRISSRETHD